MKSRRMAVLAAVGLVALVVLCLGLSLVPVRVQVNGWQMEAVRVIEVTAMPTEVIATATSVSRHTVTPIPTPTLSPVPTPLPTATSTQIPPTPTDSPTPTPCLPDAAFTADVTVPDGAVLMPGETFEKIWRMHSSGCAPWPTGTRWVFVSGDRMGAPDMVAVVDTPVGKTADIAVLMVAPDAPGTYEGFWQMRAPDGSPFGERAYVQIVVPEPTSPPPPQSKPSSPKSTGRPPSATNEPPPP
jgi:hypothetical protein